MNGLAIKPEYVDFIRWNSRGSCGNSGCKDPECCCSFCLKPIGVSDADPRWNEHNEFCLGCELCEDTVPLILFRGEGKRMQQAQFHSSCFNQIIQNN